ncbi:unnamed protein product [Echinostoma caproni]|uniref:BRCA1/BRCA2-containing complex subunit 45 n=1 Tax=Echinostoma caproni TaxID=27848 RepID=A0A183AZN6_9TREM|nr:unnamed protein product [Echinostoma caproni]
MSTDVDSTSIFQLNSGYSNPLSESDDVNNRLLFRRGRGVRKRAASSKQTLNGLMDESEIRKQGEDSCSPNENLIQGKSPSEGISNTHELHNLPHAIDPNVDVSCSKQGRTISVHETYQLGYFDPTSDTDLLERLYVFDFVDGLEVTYPISVTSSDTLPADLPPLFLEPEYVDQLSTLASNALNQLTTVLANWLIARQRSQEERLMWHHMSAHEEAVLLRKQVVQLIDQLVPTSHLESTLDFHSPLTDKFLTQLISVLTRDTMEKVSTNNASEGAIPIVSLCPDPTHCLNALRTQIYQLLRILVPHLRLPQSFHLERDLHSLLSILRECNARSS